MLRTFSYQSFEVAPSWFGTPSFLLSRPGSFFVVGSLFISVSSLLGRKREVWKTAEITPVPKQGNHELPNITDRFPCCLHCQRIAREWHIISLSAIWQPRKGLPQKQSDNKKWFSTETSLIHTTDAFLKGIDDKKLTACVLLDISRKWQYGAAEQLKGTSTLTTE